MSTKIITARTDETHVPLATLKLHGKIDSTVDDTLLAIWRSAAFEYAEHYTGRSFGAQVRELALDAFPAGAIVLPAGPVTSITSVTYIDTAGDATVLAADQYSLDDYSDPQYLVPAYDVEWPDTLDVVNAVKVRYAAGAATLPTAAYSAILLLVRHADAHREAVGAAGKFEQVPMGVHSLLDTLKDYSRAC